MAEPKPAAGAAAPSASASATPHPAATAAGEGNPALRMLGLPRLRARLPSRNWLLFLSATASVTAAVLYDRTQARRVQQRWCDRVAHLAGLPLAPDRLPRRVTIFLAAPPGDSTRPARKHFHAHVKPVLVAAALDWDVVEGRREGEVRARWAERIRERRRRGGERGAVAPEEDVVEEARRRSGVREVDDRGGHLVIGRHTWKEYVRGLHEGWLGPLDPPPLPPEEAPPQPASPSDPPLADPPATDDAKPAEKPAEPPPEPSRPPVPAPYLAPAAYADASLAPTCPDAFPASAPLPLPHLLGVLRTPQRVWRFLHRRRDADVAGRWVAALVLAEHARPYATGPATAAEGVAAADGAEAVGRREWEQRLLLAEAEPEWHKSAWADPPAEGEGGEKKASKGREEGERPWREEMAIDGRIGERMRTYGELESALGQDDGPQRTGFREGRSRKWLGGADEMWEPTWGEWARGLVGWQEAPARKGWEDGLVGDD